MIINGCTTLWIYQKPLTVNFKRVNLWALNCIWKKKVNVKKAITLKQFEPSGFFF